MKTYRIRYEETSVKYIDITAASEAAALKEFEVRKLNDDIKFTDMEVIKTVTTTV